MRRASFCKVIALVCLLVAPTALAQEFDFFQLPVPGPFAWPWDVNNQGQVVGFFQDPDNGFALSGFVSDLEGYVAYTRPGAAITTLGGINERGELTGYYWDGTGHGFLLDHNGEETVIEFPDHVGSTAAWGLNNRGTMTGTYCDTTNPLCGGATTNTFVRTKQGSFEPVAFPGAVSTVLLDINDREEICGLIVGGGTFTAIVGNLKDGFTVLDVPGAFGSEARGINNRGEVVGQYEDADGSHGFLWEDGEFITVDYPGASGSFVTGITDSGDIIGVFDDANGQRFGYYARRR